MSIDNFMLEYWALRFADLLAKREPVRPETFRGLDRGLTLQRVLECTAGGLLPPVISVREGMEGAKQHTDGSGDWMRALEAIIRDESRTILYAVPALFTTPTAVSAPGSATTVPAPLREFLADFGWISAGAWVTDATLATLAYVDVYAARTRKPSEAIEQLLQRLVQSAAVPPAFRSKLHLRYLLVAGSKDADASVFSGTEHASWASLATGSDAFLHGDQTEIVPSGGDPDGFYRAIFHGRITRQARVIQNFCTPSTSASLRIQQVDGGGHVALVEMVTDDERRGLQFLACPAEDPDTFQHRLCRAFRSPPDLLGKRVPSVSTFYVPVDAN